MPCRKSLCVVLLFLFALAPALVKAQTASSALVTGTVYDPSQAVVPGASVELRDKATSLALTQSTNALGVYTFASVLPGTYKLTVTAQGFRTAVIPELRVAVAQSYTVNVTLEVGTATQTVEVQAAAAVELQKTDASVGDVIGGDELKYLPTPNRQVSALLTLQPLVMPIGAGISTDTGGQVAGARADQTVFLLDGGDATSNTEGSGGYNSQFEGEIRPIVPVPAESIEEFRVGTTNPNATFGRSQGAQVSMVTKRGTNTIHGSAYWYHQNDNLNANTYDLNVFKPDPVRSKRPELKDNRYGATAGGPVLRDRLWLFGHYEGRRFPQTFTFNRVVPTATLRQGILIFNGVQYNLNPANGPLAQTCGPSANAPCDPRGLGVSPVSLAAMNALPAVDPSVAGRGDGVNTGGYRSVIATGITSEFAVARLDYKINDKWNFFGTGRYYYYKQPGTQQIDIVGISGCSAPCSTRVNPLQPRYYSAGVNGQLTPNLLSETRFSWYRHWWEWATQAPFPQVSGTAAALSMGGEGTGASGSTKIADAFNIDTQNARSRVWNGKDTFISQNLTWLKGAHTWQFGGSYRFESIFHNRTDKVTGGLSKAPIFYLQTGSFFRISASDRPPGLSTTDTNRWNALFAALMGIPDRSAQLLSRDGQLNPQTLGTPLLAQVRIQAVEGYFQDMWKMFPSLTVTYGLTYQVQKPPTEEKGRQMVPIFAATGNAVDLHAFYRDREAAAVQGNILNPDIAYTPIRSLRDQKYVAPIDWNNYGPRVAAAWNPSFSNWFFGNRKTVIRGGWGVTYTRMNGVGLVMTPLLGVGLGEILSCKGPISNGTCAGASTPATAFRVGIDGTGSSILPSTITPSPAQIPFPVSKVYGETRSFMINPSMELGFSHSFDLTWQRELPYDMLVEFGYVGRLGRNLTQNVDMNAAPFMMTDNVSGQTMAAAMDNLALAARAGTPVCTSTITTGCLSPQPFFENLARTACLNAANASTGCSTFQSVTGYLMDTFGFEASIGDLWSIMGTSGFGVDVLRFNAGQQPFSNLQVFINNYTNDTGLSDYHAGFVSLRKRFAHGLTFDANYTYGQSTDLFGLNQENTQFSYSSPFRRDFDRGPSIWDRRHVFNAHWYYELPFGRGKRWSAASNALDKFVGGWHIAGIWTMAGGLPLCAVGYSNYGALTAANCNLPINSNLDPGNKRHLAVLGSGGVGTTGDMNLFANPEQVFNNFKYPLMTVDQQFGMGALRGLPRWNADLSVGKKTTFYERYTVAFTFDFLNAFNHVQFNDPSVDLLDAGSFGVLNSQFGGRDGPRRIQFGVRFEF